MALSIGLHVGAITLACVMARGLPSVPRAAVRFAVLLPDTSVVPTPATLPDLVEVRPEPVVEAPLPEPPELPDDREPAPTPPCAAVSEPPPPRLEHFALATVRRVVPTPVQQPAEPAVVPPPEPTPVADVELAASAPMPDLGNSPAPQYPPAARRHRLQGTVIVRFEVAADGTPSSCEIEVSSGYALLDDAALEAARKWRFTGGAGQVRVPFAFELRVAVGSLGSR